VNTPGGRGISLWLMGRLGWVLVGALIVAAFGERLFPYREVETTRIAIIRREVPFGPPSLGQRIQYVYKQPDVRAVAPGAVTDAVTRFCRPTLVAQTDTVRATGAVPSVIRSVVHRPALLPLARDGLLVTSMDSYGDLIAEDFRVRPGFGIRAGLDPPFNTVVRYSRLAPLREIAGGALWYVAFRAVEAVVR
jgi:hypothetical protein